MNELVFYPNQMPNVELTSNIIPKGHESSNVKVQMKVRSVS